MATSDELKAKLEEIELEISDATVERDARRLLRLQRRQDIMRKQLLQVQLREKRKRAETFRVRISELSVLAAAVIAALEAVSNPPTSVIYCLGFSSVFFLLIFLGSISLAYLTQTEREHVFVPGIREFGSWDLGLVVGVVLAGLLAVVGIGLLVLTTAPASA